MGFGIDEGIVTGRWRDVCSLETVEGVWRVASWERMSNRSRACFEASLLVSTGDIDTEEAEDIDDRGVGILFSRFLSR